MSSDDPDVFPPYSYVPGGRWPHPTAAPGGHSRNRLTHPTPPIADDRWEHSYAYIRGFALFNAGYYWEAHEAWEGLWHAHGRRGAVARLLQGLIKLAAAGVKVRECRPAGVRSHAVRAARHFEESLREGGRYQLGLDLETLIHHGYQTAEDPPTVPSQPDAPVTVVFAFQILPR